MANKNKKLVALLDAAVAAINAAQAEAQRQCPGATLYLEAGGTLYALKPEPESQKSGDTSTADRMALIFATATLSASCDVGAW